MSTHRHPSLPELRASVMRLCVASSVLFGLAWVALPWAHVGPADVHGPFHRAVHVPAMDISPLMGLNPGHGIYPQAAFLLLMWIGALALGTAMVWARGRVRWGGPPVLLFAAACVWVAPKMLGIRDIQHRFFIGPPRPQEVLWAADAALVITLLVTVAAVYVAWRQPLPDIDDLSDLRPTRPKRRRATA